MISVFVPLKLAPPTEYIVHCGKSINFSNPQGIGFVLLSRGQLDAATIAVLRASFRGMGAGRCDACYGELPLTGLIRKLAVRVYPHCEEPNKLTLEDGRRK